MLRAAILCLVLAGCTAAETVRGSGERAPAPGGWTVGCLDNPGAVMCPKKKETPP